jgi:hypothetical protein
MFIKWLKLIKLLLDLHNKTKNNLKIYICNLRKKWLTRKLNDLLIMVEIVMPKDLVLKNSEINQLFQEIL